MLKVLSCLASSHDWRLTMLAACICLFGSGVTISICRRAVAGAERLRRRWVLLGAITAGGSIWSSHFIAMLAFRPGVPLAYSAFETLLSLALAVAISATGLYFATQSNRKVAALGGVIVGIAIAAMHYVGMLALRVPGHTEWEMVSVAISIGLSVSFAAAAFWIRSTDLRRIGDVVAALALSAAVASLHISGMSAVTIVPNGSYLAVHRSMSPAVLAVMVGAAALSVLMTSLVTSALDRRNQKWIVKQKALLDDAVNNMAEGLCMFDANSRVVIYNERFRRMLGVSAEELKGASFLSVLNWRKQTGELLESPALYASRIEHDVARGIVSEHMVTRSNGTIYRVVKSPCDGGGWVSTFEDITTLKNAENHISFLANHDALTNLPNRSLFSEEFKKLLASKPDYVAVMCLDLVRFRDVNDWFGRATGDKLLELVSERLSHCLRANDLIGRFGGDEFIIVQAGERISRADIAKLARRLLEAVGLPYSVEGREISIGASIGVAIAPIDGDEQDQLLKRADLALYQAKSEGKGTFRFFEISMNEEAEKRRQIERDLCCAVEGGEFELRYQPLFDLSGKIVLCAEALIRWNHPVRGLLGPGEFIPIAEQVGLIVPISEWVIKQACRDAATWPDSVRVAVNLSPIQFKAGRVLQAVKAALQSSGMRASRLECEITESILLQDTTSTISTLRELKSIGVRIAMDDFGTGYSSLSYLMKFPFDKIKIDQSFVREIASSGESRAIIEAVIHLARQLRIKTTAEGVETEEQLKFLGAQGCAEIQGYLFSPPVTNSEIGRLISAAKAA